MGTLGETSPEEIAPPSCRLFLGGPRARGRPHPAPGPARCGTGSWAATSREWVRSAPWPSLVATAGSPWGAPSFALAPAPCPGEPPAQASRVPMGQLAGSPIATRLSRRVRNHNGMVSKTPSLPIPMARRKPEHQLSMSRWFGQSRGDACQNHPRHGCHIYKKPKATGSLVVQQSAAPAHFSGYGTSC